MSRAREQPDIRTQLVRETSQRTFADEEDPLPSPEGLYAHASPLLLHDVLVIVQAHRICSSHTDACTLLADPALLRPVRAPPARSHLGFDSLRPVFLSLFRPGLLLALRRRVLLFRKGCSRTEESE